MRRKMAAMAGTAAAVAARPSMSPPPLVPPPLVPPLQFEIVARCGTTKARVARMVLPHHHVDTPVFMPVGTQGTMKGLTAAQLRDLGCQIVLGNTYHLGNRPGPDVLAQHGGLHRFMDWDRNLLTDSGGFQMVSLLKLADVTEEGVRFQSPHDGSELMLTPEKSIELQNTIGADIIMQLDDVVSSLVSGPRVEEAMHRSVRWLDRCIQAHQRPAEQCLFPIIQGGLDPALRRRCIEEMTRRPAAGFAIGGLSGGEDKDRFWSVIDLCTDLLPSDKPRYCMGVGFATDLVVCAALGVDMFDCVFPTRTARFGTALVPTGSLVLRHTRYAHDFGPVDPDCPCSTCKTYSRSYLHTIVTHEPTACHLLSVHNIAYQLRLMGQIRAAVIEDRFPEFVRTFMAALHPDGKYPAWAASALAAVHIHL